MPSGRSCAAASPPLRWVYSLIPHPPSFSPIPLPHPPFPFSPILFPFSPHSFITAVAGAVAAQAQSGRAPRFARVGLSSAGPPASAPWSPCGSPACRPSIPHARGPSAHRLRRGLHLSVEPAVPLRGKRSAWPSGRRMPTAQAAAAEPPNRPGSAGPTAQGGLSGLPPSPEAPAPSGRGFATGSYPARFARLPPWGELRPPTPPRPVDSVPLDPLPSGRALLVRGHIRMKE